MWLLWVIGGQQGDSLLLMEKKKQMSELETKKYAKEDSQLPKLSLNPNTARNKNTASSKDETTEEQQEALWSRSLKFFEHMNAVNS